VLAVGCLLALASSGRQLRPQASLLGKVALAALPAAALIVFADLPSVLLAILALAAYGAVIIATRALPAELAELLPARWRARPR
jgi:hypothetical protein